MSFMVHSFERVLKILELGNRFNLCSSALAKELNCTKRTAQRYMHELESEGYLYPVGAKFFKGDTYFLLTDKSKKLLGIDMTNNQKIELAQVECKHCLNCSGWVPPLTDWDVMQSGYSEKQLYPQQLEVLEMHDVPCTTIVDPERVVTES